MDTNESNHSNRTEVYEFNEIPVTQPPQITPTTTMLGLWLIPVTVVAAAWIVVLLKQSILWKVLQTRLTTRKPFQQIPCFNCQYFNSNPHLQCAVQPSRALKKDAVSCPDYCEKAGQQK